jgi:signal transduction histidine kinase
MNAAGAPQKFTLGKLLMSETLVRTGAQAFRPRARIIRTLGRELISNEIIAMQELIKNAYDADSSVCLITFVPPLLPNSGEIIIEDDGEGMTLEVLQTAWMEPATLSKVRRTRSGKYNRRLTGEKGIGRFASARIASALELTSISSVNGRRVKARFDWGRFDDEAQYLDEIKCEWIEDDPPSNSSSGTILRLIGLHDDWTREKGAPFRVLRSELSRLVSPLSTPDFSIVLEVPDPLEEYSGEVTPPAFLAKPRYWITGSVNGDGTLDAIYEGPGSPPQQILEGGQLPKVTGLAGEGLQSGPFTFELRVWDRTSEDLRAVASEFESTLKDIRRDLDAASGIRIYRDGFRVLLPDNDWLRLDLRRVQNPTMRLSNNQVVGLVSISRDDNPELTDQTNRQGIVDSPAFDDFKTAVKYVLSRLEIRRDVVRRPSEEVTTQKGIFANFDVSGLRDYVSRQYQADKTLLQLVSDTEKSLTSGVDEVKTVLARYRRLATLGQLVDGILHEGRTPITAISNAVMFIAKDLEKLDTSQPQKVRSKVLKRLETITEQAERLSDLFRRIAPFSGRKRGRPRSTTVERMLADVVSLAQNSIDELGVHVALPIGNTPVTLDSSEMQSLFFNLLENALYWLTKVPSDKRAIVIQVDSKPSELQVTFSDSGPGVEEEIRDRIFDPYFSTRADGVGLGLALAGEITADHDGKLELLADGPLDGATFRVTLKDRVA